MRRLLPFLALAALLAGCGSASKTSSRGGSIPAGASVVRAGVVAFVAVDSDTGSSQWKQLDELAQKFPGRDQAGREAEAAAHRPGRRLRHGREAGARPRARHRGRERRQRVVDEGRRADEARRPRQVQGARREAEREGLVGRPSGLPRGGRLVRALRQPGLDQPGARGQRAARGGRRLQGSDGQASGRRARQGLPRRTAAERARAAVVVLGHRCARARQAEVRRRLGERGGRRRACPRRDERRPRRR